MNREYLGPKIKRGTFLYRSIQVGDFVIGKWASEELDSYLKELKLPMAVATPLVQLLRPCGK